MNDIENEWSDLPNEKYRKFFATFADIETLDIKEWKPSHLIGYFVKKYQEHYGIKYSFKFNTPSPVKCFEVFQIKKLGSIMTAKPELLKLYIDWVFVTKVKQAKRRLTSISFLTQEATVQEYKKNVLFINQANKTINRTTPLLQEKQKFLEALGCPLISTYGDLYFYLQTIEQEERTILIEQLGFEQDILDRIV
jgi:hypothetical protein